MASYANVLGFEPQCDDRLPSLICWQLWGSIYMLWKRIVVRSSQQWVGSSKSVLVYAQLRKKSLALLDFGCLCQNYYIIILHTLGAWKIACNRFSVLPNIHVKFQNDRTKKWYRDRRLCILDSLIILPTCVLNSHPNLTLYVKARIIS